MRGCGWNKRDPHLSNELNLFPVVVAASEERHFPGVDLPHLEPPAQGTAIRPPAMARRIIQIRVRVDVEDAQPSVEATLLRDQRRARGGVVASEHDREGALRRPL